MLSRTHDYQLPCIRAVVNDRMRGALAIGMAPRLKAEKVLDLWAVRASRNPTCIRPEDDSDRTAHQGRPRIRRAVTGTQDVEPGRARKHGTGPT